MALWYIKTSGKQYTLAPIFGMVPSSVNVWVDYALEVLYRSFKKNLMHHAGIKWPTVEQMAASALQLVNNRPNGALLDGVFAITDGCRIPCADYITPDIQNAYYEGYTQSVEVTNLFVWNFFGEKTAAINYPGSWHDSKLAYQSGLIFPMLSDEHTPPAFPSLVIAPSSGVAKQPMENCKKQEDWRNWKCSRVSRTGCC